MIAVLRTLKIQDDPEAIFQEGWLLCDVGEHETGLDYLQRAVAKGYFVAPTLAGAPAVRRAAERSRVPGAPRATRKRAASARCAAFRDAGGERLLGSVSAAKGRLTRRGGMKTLARRRATRRRFFAG